MEVRLWRPTTEVLAALVVVFAVQQALAVVDPPLVGTLFLLSEPLARPWTVATNVYAHAGIQHLLTNLVAVALFGLVVERVTTRARFHAFFLGVGALAGLSQVFVQSLLRDAGGVVGASGAVLGLLGYLVAGNAFTAATVDWIGWTPRQQSLVFGAVAVVVTLSTRGPNVAVAGHFTGLALGLLAGRLRLLHVS